MKALLLIIYFVSLLSNFNTHRILIDEVRQSKILPDSSLSTLSTISPTSAIHAQSANTNPNEHGFEGLNLQNTKQGQRILQGIITPADDDKIQELEYDSYVEEDDLQAENITTIQFIPSFPPGIPPGFIEEQNYYQEQNYTEDQIIDQTVPAWLNFRQQQQQTYLSDRYNYFVTTEKNRVWAGAMNLMWDQMKRNLLNGQNASFANAQTPIQKKFIQNLNQGRFSKDDISESAYYVMSGFGQETVKKINIQVRQKFPNKTFPDISVQLDPKNFISYAYLYKNLEFLTPFENDPSFQFNGKQVPGFKAQFSKQKNQLYYKYYNNSEDFLMGVSTKNPNDELLFLKSPFKSVNSFSFEKILKIIQMYDKMPNQKIANSDKFSMPNLEFDYTREIKEMKGTQFANLNIQDCSINGIIERLKLKITKDGVIMENQAYMIITTGWGVISKNFILDSDFWVILKQKNKTPYLVMLVRNVKEEWTI